MESDPEKVAAFAVRMRQKRNERNITFSELSAETQIGITRLFLLERGGIAPLLEEVRKIARALGVPLDYFTKVRVIRTRVLR